MSLEFREITSECAGIFASYEALRPIYMSEGHFLNQYIWKNYYHTRFATDEIALYLLIDVAGKPGAFLPLCTKENLPSAFIRLQEYFNETLHAPLNLYLTDRLSFDILTHAGLVKRYDFEDDRNSYDYIYEAEKLKTLSGRALHKKKNHLNSFLREYEGRYEYVTLTCENTEEVRQFHEKWLDERRIYDRFSCIDSEEEGVYDIFEHCGKLPCKIGGVRIDGNLVAYTIGSYAPSIQCAFIHIEKADVSYNGLYNYINQQFLLHEFPDAVFVNREDDLGQENLRQAKMSYRPLRLEEKYNLYQR